MECSFCKNKYSTPYSLLHHQKTARKCIIIQQGITETKIFKCSFCKKTLSSKARLTQHFSSCKTKQNDDFIQNEKNKIIEQKEDELEEVSFILRNEKEELEYQLRKTIEEKDNHLKEKDNHLKEKDRLIKELKDRLYQHEKNPKILNKTKNITNINIGQLTIYEVMKPEHVEEFFKKHYNLDTLLQGIHGLAKFICDSFIKEKASYICTDRSRHKFIMTDEDGNSVEDTNCEQLVSLTAPGMNHVKDVYENGLFERDTPEEIHSSYQPISALDKDTTPLRSELSKIVPSETSKKPKNNDWKKQFVLMRESYERNKPEIKTESKEEPTGPIILAIAGYSLGYLKKYKDGYRERKEKAGCEVEVKGPKSLMELYDSDPLIKEKYDRYIKE